MTVNEDKFYQDLVESVDDYAVFRLDPGGTILSWNRGARMIKGHDPEEVIGKSFRILYPPEELEDHRPELSLKIAEEWGKFREEGWRLRKDGSRFWANVTVTAIKDGHGKLLGFSKVTHDLSRELMERMKIRQTLELVLKSAQIGEFEWDIHRDELRCSRQMHELLGLGAEVELRKFADFSDLVVPEFIGRIMEEIDAGIKDGKDCQVEYQVKFPNGDIHWIHARGLVIKDPRGEAACFVGVAFNIDREKSIETALKSSLDEKTEKLKLAQASLVHSAKMSILGEIAAGISHEINTPLMAIKLSAEKIGRSELTAKVTHSASRISETASKIGKIVNGLRSFARETGTGDREDVHLSYLLDNVRLFCQNRFQNHGVILDVMDVPDVSLSCHSAQIEHVLMNLLNNAFDAVENADSKIVNLSFQYLPSCGLSISVSDSGPGIPEEIRDKVMLPFFSTKSTSRGNGLGLSIALGIMRSYEGDLILEEGGATTFTLKFPKCLIKA